MHYQRGVLCDNRRLISTACLLAALTVSITLDLAHAQEAHLAPDVESAARAASKMMDEFIDSGATPGVVVSVGIDGEIVWHDGFGYADLEQRVPIWPELTLFRVGSLAKPMTALAIGQLYEQGRLDLDEPIQMYVPSFPEKRWPVTARQVAGHIAGIRHYIGDEMLAARHYDTVLEGLTIFEDDTLMFEPGTRYEYSSYGWNLLSAVVEGASGEDFLGYMDENVFRPLGMTSTTADQVRPIILHRSRYYDRDSLLTFVNSPWVDNSYKWAGGGFLSTADDLVRFGFAHLDPTTVSKETVAMLWESQTTSDGAKTNYGIGWDSGVDDNGRRWAGHTGGSIGGSTFFRIYPDQGLVIAIIANATDVHYQGLQFRIAELFLSQY